MPITQEDVAHVVLLRTQPKVRGANTCRSVARMQKKVKWFLSMQFAPGEAMRKNDTFAVPEAAIAMIVYCSRP